MSAFSQFRDRISTRFYSLFRWAGAYAPLLSLFALVLVITGVSRCLLVAWQADRVMDTGIGAEIFIQGLRADAILAGLAVAIPLLFLPVLAHRYTWKYWKRFTFVWVLLVVFIVLFMELATPTFIGQYDIRPNRLFVEYLKFPQEVFSTLWNGFRVQLVGGVALTIALTAFIGFLMKPWLRETRQPGYGKALLAWPLVVVLVFMSVRSTTEHRPANPALFALTSDAMVNSLIINSTWSVAFAIYNLKHESNADKEYGTLANDTIIDEIRQAPWLADKTFVSDQYPTMHEQKATHRRQKPLNLVIVLEESLGATFVESLGGKPLTPQLEELGKTGWWFENLYATGTRSVRGIEAVISGYLPSPARSVVKLSLAQRGFFTIAELLKSKGYNTGFMYGGEAHFDNMRSFFSGNGFDHIIDQNDYQNPVFTGSWGVSDEDLFNRVDQKLDQLNAAGQPFFRLVFSSSNHSPFQFPDGRITLEGKDKNTVDNAVKYADYALGSFIKKARTSDYWDNTLFLIVADHDARVWGNELVPIKNFHIPGVILGADIQPRTIKTVASQVDLSPTLLSLMGIDSVHPMIGRDLTRQTDAPGRAMMQFDSYYAWMDGDFGVTVLRQDKQPLRGIYNPATGTTKYLEAPVDPTEAKNVLAHALLPLWLYRNKKYAAASDPGEVKTASFPPHTEQQP
jgi:phosphoglycerol transferase MdoB-like AlkP superfamily enzyme